MREQGEHVERKERENMGKRRASIVIATGPSLEVKGPATGSIAHARQEILERVCYVEGQQGQCVRNGGRVIAAGRAVTCFQSLHGIGKSFGSW